MCFVCTEMDFATLNKKGQLTDIKPRKKITELEINKQYPLVDIKAIHTGFGRKIIAECEDFVTYLPARFDTLTDDQLYQLKEANITEWCIKFTGIKDYGIGKQARLIEFGKM